MFSSAGLFANAIADAKTETESNKCLMLMNNEVVAFLKRVKENGIQPAQQKTPNAHALGAIFKTERMRFELTVGVLAPTPV